jgi:perosamine synthetase
MIVTNNEPWARHAKHLTTQAKADPIEYIHDEIGYNYRLTNMQAAMGCAQLEQLGEYVEMKRRIARTYIEAFKDVRGITPMREAPWAFSNFWMFTVLVDAKLFGMTSRQLLKILADKKIQARPLWQPIHLSKAHAGSQPQCCPTAERLYENCLSLPCSVGLSDADLGRVVEAVCKSCDT